MHLYLFLTQPFVFQLHNIGSKDAHVIPIGKTLEVWVLISNTNRSGGSSVGSNKVALWTGVWLYGHMVMMVYTDCALRQPQFHMAPTMSTTKQCFNHFGEYSKCVKLRWVTHSELHITRAQWVCSETENSTLVAIVKHWGLISRWGTQQVFIYVHVYKVQYWQTKVGHRHPKIICHQIVRNPHFSWDKSFFNFLLVWLKYFASFFHNMKEYQHSCISWCKFRGFDFASLSPLKLWFLLVYYYNYMDFKVQHPKITCSCKEKNKILDNNHQKNSNEENWKP